MGTNYGTISNKKSCSGPGERRREWPVLLEFQSTLGAQSGQNKRSVALGRRQLLCNWPALWQRQSQMSQILKGLFKSTREPPRLQGPRSQREGGAEPRPNLAPIPAIAVPSASLEWLQATPHGRTLMSRTWVGLSAASPSAFSSVSLCHSLNTPRSSHLAPEETWQQEAVSKGQSPRLRHRGSLCPVPGGSGCQEKQGRAAQRPRCARTELCSGW